MSNGENRKQDINEKVKKYIEENNITVKDVKNAFKIISMYYYYRIAIQEAKPVDVVLEINPALSEVKNIASILSIWRNVMYRYMQEVANTIRSLTPESEIPINLNDPNSLARYILMMKMRTNKEEEINIEDFEINEIDSETLKKSIEKVKKIEQTDSTEQ